jgi:hypothetical protein
VAVGRTKILTRFGHLQAQTRFCPLNLPSSLAALTWRTARSRSWRIVALGYPIGCYCGCWTMKVRTTGGTLACDEWMCAARVATLPKGEAGNSRSVKPLESLDLFEERFHGRVRQPGCCGQPGFVFGGDGAFRVVLARDQRFDGRVNVQEQRIKFGALLGDLELPGELVTEVARDGQALADLASTHRQRVGVGQTRERRLDARHRAMTQVST